MGRIIPFAVARIFLRFALMKCVWRRWFLAELGRAILEVGRAATFVIAVPFSRLCNVLGKQSFGRLRPA